MRDLARRTLTAIDVAIDRSIMKVNSKRCHPKQVTYPKAVLKVSTFKMTVKRSPGNAEENFYFLCFRAIPADL